VPEGDWHLGLNAYIKPRRACPPLQIVGWQHGVRLSALLRQRGTCGWDADAEHVDLLPVPLPPAPPQGVKFKGLPGGFLPSAEDLATFVL
jgi:hypothetical protein